MAEKRNQLNNNSGRGAGQQAGTNLGDQRAIGTHKQSAVIFDMISEGPIEGLVEGDARSIYLNGVPAVNPDSTNAKKYLQTRSNDTTFTASSLTLVDNESAQNLFQHFQSDETDRYLSIESAGKIFTSSISTVAGSNIITIKGSSSDTFVAADIRDFDSSNSTNTLPLTRFIRIPGAGVNGGELIASIVRIHNTKKAQIQEIASTSVTDVTATMDAVLKATFGNSTQATVTNTGNTYTLRDVANVRSILSGSTRPRTTEDTPFNFKTFEWGFTTGERTQTYRETPVGIGSSAIIYPGAKEALNQVTPGTGQNGSGYPVNGAGGFTFSNTGTSNSNTMTEGSANAFNKSHTQLGVTNAGEIDQIRINIGFDSLYAMDTDNGEQKGSRAEFRVTFSYSRDGGSSFTDVVVFGPKGDLGGIIDDFGAAGTGGSTSGRKFDRSGFLDEGDKSGYVRRNSSTPFVYILSFDTEKFQPFDSYNIKIERLDAINFFKDGNQHQNASFLQSIEQIIEDKLNYPYTAYSQILIGAEDFQSIPTRSYELRGMKVKVPTNYFPKDELDTEGNRRTTASYQRNVSSGADAGSDQDWDGNFRGDHKTFIDPDHVNYNTVYTNNPVWILLDLLTNKRYGLGSYIDPEFDLTQIDKYKLFQIAKYCDELVPDGKGGTEPRFTCNAYISQQQEALKLINDLMSVFRGILIWQNGQVSLNSNRQSGAIYTFGKSNVLGGQFRYQSSATRKRINQVRVTWNDPDNSYKQEVEVVEDYDNIAETQRIINKDIRAFGCTSQGQAHRLGKWNLFTETLDSEVVSFKTSINAGFLNPGDIIKVQDADRHNVQFSGRIANYNPEAGLTLDETMGSGGAAVNIDAAGGNQPDYTGAETGQPTVFAGEVTLPKTFSQDACLWEHGGTGVGSWLGVRDISGVDNLVLRSGEGLATVTATSVDGIITEIPISQIPEFDGGVHTVCWEFHPQNGTHRLWIDGKKYIDDVTTGGGAFDGSKWSGGNPGGWLKGQSTASGAYSIAAWPVTAGSSGLRHYFNETVSSSNDGNSTTKILLDRSVTLSGSGNSFLHLIYPSGGALLAQPKATINSVNYVAGDLVLTDENGAAIDTEVKASTVYDDSGNAVLLQWSENSRVETKQISGGSGSASITVSSAFSSPPNSEVIWAITTELADGSETDGSSEEYMVIAIDEQDDKSFDISAAPYNSEKYDLVDRGYVIPDIPAIMLPPKKADQVPAPQNISLMPKRVGGKGFKQSKEPSSVGDYDLLVSWSHPIVGNAMYEFVNQYEIKHNVGDQNSSTGQTEVTETILVDGKTNSLTIKGLTSGRSRVSIRLINSAGYVSDFVHRTINFDPSKERTTQNSIGTKNSTPVAYGGSISKGQKIDSTTGIVTIGRADGYTFLPPAFDQRKTYGTSANENIESFNALADGQTGFLLVDHSDTSDPLKAIIKVEDTTAESPRGVKENYQFFARLGQSNNDITSATGTVTIADGDTEVTGSSTTFTSDYSPGDNIIIGAAGTTRFIAKITNIESNTKLFIARGVTRAYSGTSIFKHGLIIDSIKDAIISKVSRSGSTYSIERFTTEEIIGDEPIAGLLNNTTGDEGTALFNKHTLKAQTFESFRADGAISTTNFPDLRLFSQRKAGVTIPGSANNGQNDEMGRVSFTTNLIEFTNDNSGANLTNEIEIGEMKMTMTDRRNGFGLNGSVPGATMTFGLIQTGSQQNQTTIVDALSLNIHTGSTLKSLLDIDPRTGTTALKIDGTEIIDTSRNLSGIASLSVAGNVDTTSGEFKINGVTVINSSRQLRNITAMRIGATEIIDSSRNLSNIGTIDSGIITTTGSGLVPQLSVIDSDNTTGRLQISHNGSTSGITSVGTSGLGTVTIGGSTSGTSSTYCTFNSTGISVTGSVTATGDVIAFSSSDKRLKKNIVKIDSALNKVSQIGGYHFEWKDVDEAPHQGEDIGVIAQEIEKVLPEIVSERETGYKAVNYQKLTALLIEAVKELKEEIDELKRNK